MKKIFLSFLSLILCISYIPALAFEDDLYAERVDAQDNSSDGSNEVTHKSKKHKKKKSKSKITLPPSVKNEDGSVDDVDDVVLFLDRKVEDSDDNDEEYDDEDGG